MAVDHLINYQFEKERRREMAPRQTSYGYSPSAAAKEEAWSPPSERPWRPRFKLSAPRPKSALIGKKGALPPGYFASSEVKDDDCRFLDGELSLVKSGVRITLKPEDVTVNTPIMRVDDVAFRDDFTRFALSAELFRGHEPGKPLVLDIREDLFPVGLRHRFALAPRQVDITLTGRGAFVRIGSPLTQYTRLAADRRSRAGRRPTSFLSKARISLVVMVACLGLITGTSVSSFDLTEKIRAGVELMSRTDTR